MPFKMPRQADKFFKNIWDTRIREVDVEFDLYYFCFIAGIATGQKENLNSKDIVDYFPDKYKHRSRILLALFLNKELQNLGVAMSEKHLVYSQISRLVNPEAPNHLSDEGLREFNRYAHGGYLKLQEWFEAPPQSLEAFLRRFKINLDEALVN